MKARSLILAVVMVLVAGGAAIGAMTLLRSATDDAVEHVPADAVFYANVFLDPSAEQKMAIESLLKKFPDAGTPEKAGDQIAKWFDEAFGDAGLKFGEDVEPWLGKQIAVYFGNITADGETPDGAALIATEDEDATKEAIAKSLKAGDVAPEDKTYKDVEYQTFAPPGTPAEDGEELVAAGVTDGFLVVGTEAGFKSVVDAPEGESLAESDLYKDSVAKLTKDRVALFFYNLESVGEALESAPGMTPGAEETQKLLDLTKGQSAAGAVYARETGMVLETSQPIAQGNDFAGTLQKLSDVDLVPELSSDVWGAIAVGSLGDYLEVAIDSFSSAMAETSGGEAGAVEQQFQAMTGLNLKEDLLSWIGDTAFFVQGADPVSVGGGVLIESESPAKSTAALKALSKTLGAQGIPVKRHGDGYLIAIPGGQPIKVVTEGDKVVIAYGEQAAAGAIAADARLAEGETFTRASEALGRGYSVSVYFDLSAAIGFFENIAPTLPPTYENDVKPNLDPLDYVIAGQIKDGERVLTRLVIGVE
jgi:hypothetical protein